jgi:ceramide glucosyltransferase
MTAVFCFFAGLLVLMSLKSFADGLAYLRFFRTETSRPLDEAYKPFATVIVPCRGVDPGLSENLAALLRLDYPKYELIFVSDSAADPSIAVIEAAIDAAGSNSPPTSRIVIAPTAERSSQKVENLREAVLHARPESEVFVFVDSDARVSPQWLHAIVEPLSNPEVGASTGYRWFLAERPGFITELRSCWNASIASALGPNTSSNFCWGGSMAMRRETFERLGLRDKWLGTLSDDFVATRTIRNARLGIAFVPRAMAATVEDCTAAEMLEFTTRQIKITRVYMPRLWVLTLIGSILHVGVMIASITTALAAPRSITGIVAIVTLILLISLSTAKAYVRLTAVKLALSAYNEKLRHQLLPQLTLWSVTPIIFLYNSLAAAFSRRIRWRSTVYELKSPDETVIIAE